MIRAALPADVPGMVALFRAQHAAMNCAWRLDADVLAGTFYAAIAAPASWLCLTGDACLLLASCFESPVGAGRLAAELALCASPRRFDELVDLYEDWARAKGCREASLSCVHRFPAFARLYRRRGYRPAEMTMSRVL